MNVNQVQTVMLGALQQGSKDILVSLIQDGFLCMAQAKHITIKPSNLWLARRIQGDDVLHL